MGKAEPGIRQRTRVERKSYKANEPSCPNRIALPCNLPALGLVVDKTRVMGDANTDAEETKSSVEASHTRSEPSSYPAKINLRRHSGDWMVSRTVTGDSKKSASRATQASSLSCLDKMSDRDLMTMRPLPDVEKAKLQCPHYVSGL